MKRRVLFIVVVMTLLIGAGVVFLFHYAGNTGTNTVEQWIGSQLQSIANSYLNPQLSFDSLDYQYPGTVTLKNLKLVADDSTQVGKQIDILNATSATITLAEIPQVGKPIVIERISLNQPAVLVLFDTETRSFVGFSHIVKEQGNSAASQPSAPTQPSTIPKLSDFFKIKLIELIDGKVTYDPRIIGTEAMELDRINTVLNIAPDSDGLYHLDCKVSREGIFDFALGGKLDIDHFNATDVHATMNASLSQEKLSFLPPQLQKLAKKYEARGTLSLDLTGNVPIFHPLGGDANLKLTVTDANLAIDNYCVPVDSLSLTADFKDARVNLREMKLTALEGEATATGMMLLNESLDAAIRIDIANMLMQKLVSAKADGELTQLRGRINAHIEATAPAAIVLAKWNTQRGTTPTALASQSLRQDWGLAKIKIIEGRLAVLPVMRELNSSLRKVTSLVGGSGEPNDKLDVDAVFTQDRIEIKDTTFTSEAIAARGKGFISLDHTIDLTLNGGPLEKMQSLLGGVGELLGKFTDSLAHYRVSGTIENVSVSVEFGEKAVDTVKNVGEKTVEGVGKGIEKIGKGIEGIFGQ